MRNLIFITCILFSCSPASIEEKAISEYAQTIGTTKTEMHFNLISMETVKEVKAQDSIDYYLTQIAGFSDGKTLLDTLEKRVIERATIIGKDKGEDRIGSHARKFMDQLKKQQPLLEKIVSDLKVYVPDPDRVIGKHIKCDYTIENPVLNNAKQEISRVFYYSTVTDRVLTSL